MSREEDFGPIIETIMGLEKRLHYYTIPIRVERLFDYILYNQD